MLRVFVSVVLLESVLLARPLVARTWTDSKGRTLEAEYAGLQGERVQLRQPDGKMLEVPLANFSAADQAFVRQQTGSEASPAPSAPAPAPAAGGEFREWTDRSGRKVTAKLERLQGETAVLATREGQVFNVPMANLSEGDQQLVKGQPGASPAPSTPAAPLPMPGAAPYPTAPYPTAPYPTPPTTSPMPMAVPAGTSPYPTPPSAKPMMPTMPSPMTAPGATSPYPGTAPMPMTAPMPTTAPMPMTAPSATTPYPGTAPMPMTAPSPMTAPMPMTAPSPTASYPGGPSPMTTPSPMFVEVYECSKCRKPLPTSVKAGDSCPHCGAYLAYSEGPGGNRQYASPSFSGGSMRGLIKLGVFVVVLIASAIGWAIKKMNGGE